LFYVFTELDFTVTVHDSDGIPPRLPSGNALRTRKIQWR